MTQTLVNPDVFITVGKEQPKTRQKMIDYLKGHFRYNTMSSWNGAHSYARNVKIQKLNILDPNVRSRAYDMAGNDDCMDRVNQVLSDFDANHDYAWQAGFNGRSSGYIVLYQGGKRASQYKRVCRDCWQKNYRADSKVCGKCRSSNMHDYKGYEHFTMPGKDTDMGENFEDWDDEALTSRVELVWSFDQMVDDAIMAFVDFAAENKLEERTIMVPKKIQVAVPLNVGMAP